MNKMHPKIPYLIFILVIAGILFCLPTSPDQLFAHESDQMYGFTGSGFQSVFFLLLLCCLSCLFYLIIRLQRDYKPQARSTEKISSHENKEIKKWRQKYEDLLNRIPDGYIETDLKGIVTEVNNSVAEVLDCSRHELNGQHHSRLLEMTHRENIARVFKRIFSSGNPELIENIKVTGNDGVKRTVNAFTSLILDKEGKPEGFRCFVRDISELARAESRQSVLQEQLRRSQQIEAIGTLAGGIAHDFNNLMMAIQGNTSILLFKMSKDDPLYSKLTNIETCIHSGAELTKQLLGFAKGKKTEISPFNINNLVKETASTFRRTKKAIQLQESYPDIHSAVEADQNQIKQVILNILINTWQASPEKKQIFIRTHQIELGSSTARRLELKQGKYSGVTISNYNTKTETEKTDGEKSAYRTGINAGIGITSSSEVVKSYNGVIACNNTSGSEDTAYTIYLPVSERKEPVKSPSLPVRKNGTGTVLFVDDEEMIIEIGKPMLEELGYDVLVARGGEEAIRVYEVNKGRIDLVILDMVMPRLDGSDVYNVLKKTDPKVKTLISSGYSLDEKADELLNRGCNGFIQKPFNLKRLSRQIEAALEDRPLK